MSQFVRQQPAPFGRLRLVLPRPEDDVRTHRIGSGHERVGRFPRRFTVVHPDTTEIVTEARLEKTTRASVERDAPRGQGLVMHRQCLFRMHPYTTEVMTEALLRLVQRLFGKLGSPLLTGVVRLTRSIPQMSYCRV